MPAGQAPEHPSAATVRQDRSIKPRTQPQGSLASTLRNVLYAHRTNGYSLFTALRRSARTCQIGPGVCSHLCVDHQGFKTAFKCYPCLQQWTELMASINGR